MASIVSPVNLSDFCGVVGTIPGHQARPTSHLTSTLPRTTIVFTCGTLSETMMRNDHAHQSRAG